MNEKISELSKQMGISYADVLAMAEGIAESLRTDKVDGIYLEKEIVRDELCCAYMADQVRKVQKIQTDYLVNTNFRNQIQGFIADSLMIRPLAP